MIRPGFSITVCYVWLLGDSVGFGISISVFYNLGQDSKLGYSELLTLAASFCHAIGSNPSHGGAKLSADDLDSTK